VTFFLIVAERGPLLSPRAWGMGQSVDNGALLFSQHAHLSPANRLPPTRGSGRVADPQPARVRFRASILGRPWLGSQGPVANGRCG
jgi:hypothetical protein